MSKKADTAPKTAGDEGQTYLQMLAEWEDTCRDLTRAKEREGVLRDLLFRGAFPKPVEGTNKYKLPDGREIVGTYKLNRTVVEETLAPILTTLREMGVANADALVRYKPELVKREWDSLSDDNKLIFSRAISSKPGMPSLEIRKAKGAA